MLSVDGKAGDDRSKNVKRKKYYSGASSERLARTRFKEHGREGTESLLLGRIWKHVLKIMNKKMETT